MPSVRPQRGHECVASWQVGTQKGSRQHGQQPTRVHSQEREERGRDGQREEEKQSIWERCERRAKCTRGSEQCTAATRAAC